MKDFNLIKDDFYKNNLFKNISKQKEIPVLILFKHKQYNARMLFDYKKGNNPYLNSNSEIIPFSNGEKIQISFFYKDIFFTFETAIIDSSESTYHIQMPSMIHTSSKRMISRYTFDETVNNSVSFPNRPELFKLIDISTGGISFISEEKFLHKNEIVRNILIKINDDLEVYTDAAVVHIKTIKSELIYGLTFHQMDWPAYRKIFAFIFNKKYPNLKLLSEFSNDEVIHLYEESRHISLKSKDEADQSFFNIVRNLAKIKNNPMLAFNLVYQKSGKLLTIGSSIRIYNRSFLGQPLLTAPGVTLNPRAKTDVYIGLADFILSHPYFRYYITYIIRDYEWHHDIFKNMNGLIHNRGKFIFDELQLFECDMDKMELPDQSADFEAEVLDNPEEFIRYCEEKMPVLEVQSYNYDIDNFDLEATSQIYQILDFYLTRRLWRIKKNNRTTAFAVAESFQNDITINNIMDSCKLYFIEGIEDIQEVLKTVLPVVSQFYSHYQKRIFNIMFKIQKKVIQPVELPGLYNKGPLSRVLMNRDGLSLYKNLMKANFEYYTKYYPLSHPQKGIWYIEKMYPNTSIGNIAGTIRFKSNFDFSIIEKALNIAIEKNDALRLRITGEEGEPKQYIADYQYKSFTVHDFCDKDKSELYQWEDEMTKIPFDLINSDLFYFALIKISQTEVGIYAKFHHLIADAWTIMLLAEQVFGYCTRLLNKEEISQDNMPSYIDYILKEEEYKYSKVFEDDKKFWNEKFASIPEGMHFKPRSTYFTSTEAVRKTFIIPSNLANNIYHYCKKTNISVQTLFLSILIVYISRVTMKNDISIGTPVLNRSSAKDKETAGMFISPIPVRLEIKSEMDFTSFAQYVLKEWYLYLKHQKYPYELLLKEFRDRHKLAENLYDVTMSYQNAKFTVGKYVEEYTARWHPYHHQPELLNIHINDREDNNQFIINIDYLKELFTPSEIEELYQHMLNLMNDAIENPDKKTCDLEMLSESEKKQLLFDFNNTEAYYPKRKTIHQLFEECADKNPDHTAVVFENQELTYRELDNRANQLAQYLLTENNIQPEMPVGILTDNSLFQVIAILGILKTGGAYIPIFPDNPEERIKMIVNDSSISILVSTKAFIGILNSLQEDCPSFKAYLCLDDENDNTDILSIKKKSVNNDKKIKIRHGLKELNRFNFDRPSVKLNLNNLAYIIYTSGTTGNPKGVMIEHKSISRTIQWRSREYKLGQKDVILQLFSYSFDGFLTSFFTPIISGSKVFLLNNSEVKDPLCIKEYIAAKKITHFIIIPTLFSALLDLLTREETQYLKIVTLAGEKTNPSLINKFKEKKFHFELVNEYGPTENSVVSTILRNMQSADNITIGKPVADTNIYILNRYNQLQPIGLAGELCLSGKRLARDYLNRPELSADKFIPNPYRKNERLYKTGDQVQWRSDGNIEYLGRIDNQVKLRGFRIELEEIENQLLKNENVNETAVIAVENNAGETSLIAYYVSKNNISASELREYLSLKLPYYMIPAKFIMVDNIPRTSSGKIDNKVLEISTETPLKETNYAAPENETEKILVKIWEEALGIEKIGINDDFFELGGDSIKAIQISSRLQEYGFKLRINEMFQHTTIAGLRDEINKSQVNKIDDNIITGIVELTPIQKWFFQNKFKNNHFNQSVMIFNKDGFLDALLRKLFSKMTEHHDALRMTYNYTKDTVIQQNRGLEEAEFFTLKQFDLRKELDFSKKIADEANIIQTSIDLTHGPLLMAGLFKTVSGDYLLIVIHHLVVDGVSWRILLEDFMRGYSQALKNEDIRFQNKTTSFKEWAGRLKEYSEGYEILNELTYWKQIEEVQVRPLPVDHAASQNKYKDSHSINLTLSETETNLLLTKVNKAYQTEINDILLTALGLAVKEWTGENLCLFNLEGHGREEILKNLDVTRTVGWFTSIYPVLLKMNLHGLSKQIKSVKENLRNIPNKGIGYGILKYLTPAEKKERLEFTVIPEIGFLFLGELGQESYMKNIYDVSLVPAKQSISPDFDRQSKLEIDSMIISKKLVFNFNYNKKEYDQTTIQKLVVSYKMNLLKIIKHCVSKESRLKSIERVDSQLKIEYVSDKLYFKNVMITGSTGLLGAHLLNELVNTTEADIYCLVRGENLKDAENRLVKTLKFYFNDELDKLFNNRIFVLNGDITLDRLGLSEADYNQIGGKIDIVFHTAALVKHYGQYTEFVKVNVSGTENIVRFSNNFHKRIIYISTTRVSGTLLKQKTDNLHFTENDFDIGQNYQESVYVKSKFEAEKIVADAVHTGLQAVVMRVGNLTGRFSDGLFQQNIKDNMNYNVIKSILILGAIPEELSGIDMEFTPVDLCSKAILKISTIKESYGKKYHIFNHHYITTINFLNMIKELNYKVKILKKSGFQNYIRDLSQTGDKKEEVNYLKNVFEYEKLLDDHYKVQIESGITQEFLKRTGFEWPEVNRDYILKIIQYMQKTGFLKP